MGSGNVLFEQDRQPSVTVARSLSMLHHIFHVSQTRAFMHGLLVGLWNVCADPSRATCLGNQTLFSSRCPSLFARAESFLSVRSKFARGLAVYTICGYILVRRSQGIVFGVEVRPNIVVFSYALLQSQ